MPYRFSEVWTREGRRAHFRRWFHARAMRTRRAAQARKIQVPAHWTDPEVLHLEEVFVGGCYDVPGFAPERGDVVIDVGCEFGDFTCVAARAGARVISFDPNPENIRYTRELLAENRLIAELYAEAVGREEGSIQLGLDDEGSSMLRAGSQTSLREVALRSLDSLEVPTVALLKVDVEGMEQDVLSGARSILLRDRPALIVEVHGYRLLEGVSSFLLGLDYRRVHMGPRKQNQHIDFAADTFWAHAALTNSGAGGSPRSVRMGEMPHVRGGPAR